MAPTVAMGQLADGSMYILACSISKYLCTNFGAVIKKCTIDQLIRSTIRGFVALRRDMKFQSLFCKVYLKYLNDLPCGCSNT